ncbi:ATP-binding protein [Streptomyces sp. NPDC050485]|uniref:ATP-binding protein n=1 Tax=Streptomyces sp. NPDC050485 TaxID=3365617 RepID=UPI0037ABA875
MSLTAHSTQSPTAWCGLAIEDPAASGPRRMPDRILASIARRNSGGQRGLDVQAACRVRELRHGVSAKVTYWGLRELNDAISVVVDELLTNALAHGDTDSDASDSVEFTIVFTPHRRVRIEVTDGSSVLPHPQQADPADEHGRGMLLLAALADRWGTELHGRGKTVWCEFDIKANDEARVDSSATPACPGRPR